MQDDVRELLIEQVLGEDFSQPREAHLSDSDAVREEVDKRLQQLTRQADRASRVIVLLVFALVCPFVFAVGAALNIEGLGQVWNEMPATIAILLALATASVVLLWKRASLERERGRCEALLLIESEKTAL